MENILKGKALHHVELIYDSDSPLSPDYKHGTTQLATFLSLEEAQYYQLNYCNLSSGDKAYVRITVEELPEINKVPLVLVNKYGFYIGDGGLLYSLNDIAIPPGDIDICEEVDEFTIETYAHTEKEAKAKFDKYVSSNESLQAYYQESESPEIIESFLSVAKDWPVVDNSESIYTQEELDEF